MVNAPIHRVVLLGDPRSHPIQSFLCVHHERETYKNVTKWRRIRSCIARVMGGIEERREWTGATSDILILVLSWHMLYRSCAHSPVHHNIPRSWLFDAN
jgi:hypothetical protein